jgi:hypothetical protein
LNRDTLNGAVSCFSETPGDAELLDVARPLSGGTFAGNVELIEESSVYINWLL